MNIFQHFLRYSPLFILGIISCKSEVFKPEFSGLQQCLSEGELSNLNFYDKITNAKASIQAFESDIQGEKRVSFLIKYENVPTGYLSTCTLPNELKKDGVLVEFSGKVYVPITIDYANFNAIPLEITEIKEISYK